MKQLPNLNKKEENFLAELVDMINANAVTKSKRLVYYKMQESFYFSADEKKMLDEIASKITKA